MANFCAKMGNLAVLSYAKDLYRINEVDETGRILSRRDCDGMIQNSRGLEIDFANGTWNYQGENPTPIGTGHVRTGGEDEGTVYGIIGVYDKTDPRHMKNMLAVALEARQKDTNPRG
jgi:hypothetical protein